MLNDYLKKIKIFLKKYPVHSTLFLLAVSLWTSIILLGTKSYADEKYHYRQIGRFFDGRFDIIENLTTIPGYHAFLAFISKVLFGDLTRMKVRFLTLFVSLLCLFVFYLIARKMQKKDALRNTLQLAFLPISFIYFPLIYTDLFSALLVLLSLYLIFIKKYNLAGVVSLFAMATRQNNVVWHIFLWLYSYVLPYGWSFSYETVKNHIRKTIIFPLGIIAFGIFFLINGGVAIGDSAGHQAGFYMGNIYFFLAICGAILFPFLFSLFENGKRFFSSKLVYWGIVIGIVTALAFILFPPQLHGYNLDNRFLRNAILMAVYQKYSWLYAVAISLGCVSLFAIKLQKHSYIIYPFVFLYLLPSWLIEQRYMIIPFALILLFAKEKGNKVEWFTIFYYTLLSSGLFYMIMKTEMFF